MEMKDLSHPLVLTIPYPNHIPRARGIHSTNYLDGEPIRFRCNQFEEKAIKQAAELCGMSVSGFVRWTASKAADEVIRIETTPGDKNND